MREGTCCILHSHFTKHSAELCIIPSKAGGINIIIIAIVQCTVLTSYLYFELTALTPHLASAGTGTNKRQMPCGSGSTVLGTCTDIRQWEWPRSKVEPFLPTRYIYRTGIKLGALCILTPELGGSHKK